MKDRKKYKIYIIIIVTLIYYYDKLNYLTILL